MLRPEGSLINVAIPPAAGIGQIKAASDAVDRWPIGGYDVGGEYSLICAAA